jgi:hypothetical protein
MRKEKKKSACIFKYFYRTSMSTSSPSRRSSSPVILNHGVSCHQKNSANRTNILTKIPVNRYNSIVADDIITQNTLVAAASSSPQKQINAQKSSLPPLDISQLPNKLRSGGIIIGEIQRRPLSARSKHSHNSNNHDHHEISKSAAIERKPIAYLPSNQLQQQNSKVATSILVSPEGSFNFVSGASSRPPTRSKLGESGRNINSNNFSLINNHQTPELESSEIFQAMNNIQQSSNLLFVPEKSSIKSGMAASLSIHSALESRRKLSLSNNVVNEENHQQKKQIIPFWAKNLVGFGNKSGHQHQQERPMTSSSSKFQRRPMSSRLRQRQSVTIFERGAHESIEPEDVKNNNTSAKQIDDDVEEL